MSVDCGSRNRPKLRVGVIGYGSIGSVVARRLDTGTVPGCSLSGILRRNPTPGPRTVTSIHTLVQRSDVVIEAAGHEALRTHAPEVLKADRELIVLSIGALADDNLFDELSAIPTGKMRLCVGAIGGMDILRAASWCSPLASVSLETHKIASALVQPWMSAPQRSFLLGNYRNDAEIFSGTAREAAIDFPQTANVAATLAFATVGLDAVNVKIVATRRPGSQHVVRADGPSGSYELFFRNVSSPENPQSSWLTPYSVLRTLADRSCLESASSQSICFG